MLLINLNDLGHRELLKMENSLYIRHVVEYARKAKAKLNAL